VRLSNIISVVLHPIFIPLFAFYLSVKLVPSIGFLITNYLNYIYGVLVISSIILPLISLFVLIKCGRVQSIEMKNHYERPAPLFRTAFLIGLGYCLIENILIFSPILKSELLGAIIIMILAAIISKYWKISLHMLGIGGLFGIMISLNFLFGGMQQIMVLTLLIAGALGVSRINEKAHSYNQIYTGFIVGSSVEIIAILLV
jgi:hypothetical protein